VTVDRTEARAAAEAELATFSSADNPLRLVDEADVADVGWGWVYAFNTVRWFETRDPADVAPPGAGPIVVVADSGDVFHLDSTPSFDVQLAGYADRHGLPAPVPLGW
jgi:hypothetical protein